jgi:hypothetical protein
LNVLAIVKIVNAAFVLGIRYTMIKLIDKNRIEEWKNCLAGSKDFMQITKDQMWGDYLYEIWVIQEMNGDLPEEFEGCQ